MQSFTNKFSIALSQDRTEVVFNFYKNIPLIPEDNPPDEISVQVVPVANLVMTGQCAKNFSKALSDLLSKDSPQ